MQPTMLSTYKNRAKLMRPKQPKSHHRKVFVLCSIALCLIPAIASAQSFVNGDTPSAVSTAEQNAVNNVLSPIQSTIGDVTGAASGVNDVISTITNLPGQITNDLKSSVNSLLTTLEGSIGRLGQTNNLDLNAQVIDSLDPVKSAIQQNSGKLGIPDPFKTEAQILTTLPNTRTNSNLNPIVLVEGEIPMRASDRISDNVLSLQGQQEHADAFQGVLDAGTLLGLLSQASDKTGTAVTQTATSVSSSAQATVPLAQNSATAAAQITQQAGTIQSAKSTQDAIKGLGAQNARIGGILANQSNQQVQTAAELAGVSGQLSGLSKQTAQSSQQLKQIGTVLGDQDKTMRSIETIDAVSNMNLSQIAATEQGRIQQEAMQQKRDYSQLDGQIGYRFSH